MKKLFAFTLAETLIVMGIIGIVSALTLPNLNSSTGEKEKVARVKKIYQNLNDAVGRAAAVYGPVDEWFQTDANVSAQATRFGERISEFMKISKNCGSNLSNCISRSNVSYISPGSSDSLSSYINYSFILADGTAILIGDVFAKGSAATGDFPIIVDIDGPNKGSSVWGIDIFSFVVDTENNSITAYNYPFPASFITTGRGAGVTRWVIDYDNMDYLKANSSGKCPNNVTLNASANPPVVTCK